MTIILHIATTPGTMYRSGKVSSQSQACVQTRHSKTHGVPPNQEVTLDGYVGSRCETHCSQFVKTSEKLVEEFDQLLSAARRRQLREADDVCKQNTAQRQEERQRFSPGVTFKHHTQQPPLDRSITALSTRPNIQVLHYYTGILKLLYSVNRYHFEKY